MISFSSQLHSNLQFPQSDTTQLIHIPPFPFLAKSDELPKKPLGQERPVLLLPLQPDPPLEVKMNLQPHKQPDTEAQETNSITPHQTPPCHAVPRDSKTPPLPSPDPIVVHTQATPSPLMSRKTPPLPPKADKRHAEVQLDSNTKEFVTVSPTSEKGKQKCLSGGPVTEVNPMDWPPPYESSSLDALNLPAEDEIMDLPDLPPPPFLYTEYNDPSPLDRDSPHLETGPQMERRSPSPLSASPLVTQMKTSPKACLRPPTSLDLVQKKTHPLKPSPPRAFATHSPCYPRLPPQKPTKFPVSLYVPVMAGDRRPSNTSQYDNLSEADEDDRFLERPLGSTPEEVPSMHSEPQHTIGRAYDPILYPLPPPPVFIPPSRSPVPPSLGTLSSLPQEPEYEGEDSWVKDSIIPPPPPSFADRLAPFQSSPASCSDTHRAASPGYSKAFTRGPRDHSAFPAPLLYTGSPPSHARPSGQSTVGVPLVRSSPDFCRMPPGGQQLPKSVTF